ncbi:zinc finger protein 43-like [Ctenocephalides felis]|uniref:zinc finger protein 43-like n=1 Tax=Ctenocephalides felis TaxID=7515 RepID=UPI000E6E1DC8|nr:zinc finger protein 43-like [Ctenocephalides felis]
MDLDIENICRICLEHCESLKTIFVVQDNLNLKICDEIMYCTIAKIAEDDELPSKICKACLNNLNIACNFKRLCESSDSKLRMYILDKNDKNNKFDMEIKAEFDNNDNVDSLSIDCDNENDPIESNSNVAPKNKDIPMPKNMCEICGKRFRSSYDLKTHSAVHTTQRPYKCNECPKGFIRSSQLKAHMKDHIYRERKHLCTICGKGFFTTSILKNHVRTHTKERPYKCKICDKSFIQSGGLTTHMLVHTGYKGHICDICSKACTTRSDLTVHMRTHTRECPYKCEFCFKAFKTASNLLKHRRQHLNEREFKCEFCNASFNLNEGLKKHIMTHTGERPYSCKTCGKCFISHSRLAKHKRVHTREQPYSCTICSKKFGYSYSRNVHMKIQHSISDGKQISVNSSKNHEGGENVQAESIILI